jgi:hypothetical protein
MDKKRFVLLILTAFVLTSTSGCVLPFATISSDASFSVSEDRSFASESTGAGLSSEISEVSEPVVSEPVVSESSSMANSDYQNIAGWLEELEEILDSLDSYTEDDVAIPTP